MNNDFILGKPTEQGSYEVIVQDDEYFRYANAGIDEGELWISGHWPDQVRAYRKAPQPVDVLASLGFFGNYKCLICDQVPSDGCVCVDCQSWVHKDCAFEDGNSYVCLNCADERTGYGFDE